MSIFSSESLRGDALISFEDLQRGLGSLSIEDREAMDETAKCIFEDANSLATEYGVNSPEAARADELVLLYSMLQRNPVISSHHPDIPAQRRAVD